MRGGAGVAQRHHDTALAGGSPAPVPEPVTGVGAGAGAGAGVGLGDSAGEVLASYLRQQATAFLRGLAGLGEGGGDDIGPAQLMRRAADRIGGVLETYGELTDPVWAEPLRAELGWLSATLVREHQYAARLARLMSALHRLSAHAAVPAPAIPAPACDKDGHPTPAQSAPAPVRVAGGGQSAIGAARAGALLDRQLTLARTRAHSAALQATGSARFHAVADAVAVLASEVPLSRAAAVPAPSALPPCTERAKARLAEAAATLPLARSAHPYNADALLSSLCADAAPDLHDAPWNRVRSLLRVLRHALEVTGGDGDERLAAAGPLLDRHQEAAEAAAAAAAAARTPRIAPATAYALGVLHADQRGEVEAARFAFAQLWR